MPKFLELIGYLLDHEVNPNDVDDDGTTALHLTLMHHDEDYTLGLLEALLASKANPDFAENDGNTPLHLCLRLNDVGGQPLYTGLRLLAEKMPNLNLRTRDRDSALHLFCGAQHQVDTEESMEKSLRALLLNGADIALEHSFGLSSVRICLAVTLDEPSDTLPPLYPTKRYWTSWRYSLQSLMSIMLTMYRHGHQRETLDSSRVATRLFCEG